MSYGPPPLTVRNPNTLSVPGLNGASYVTDSTTVQYPIPDPFSGRTDPSSVLRITVGGKPVPPPVSIGKKSIPIQQNPGAVRVGRKPVPPSKNGNPKIVSCPNEKGTNGTPTRPPIRIEENPLQPVSDEEIYTEEPYSRSFQYPIPDPFTGRTDPSSVLRITVGGKPVPPPVSIGKKIIPIQQNPGGVLVGKKPVPPSKNKNPKIVSCPKEEGAAGAPISPPRRIEENPLQAVSDEEIYSEERLKALLESLNETEEYDVNPKEEINTSEKETNPHRIHQREKQLHMGFITPGYLNFCFGNKVTEALKTFLRTKDDMIAEEYFAPPKPDHIYPKRKFDLALSQWRKKLHLCDGPMLPYEIRIGNPDYKKIKMLTEKSLEFLNETTHSKFPADFEEYILYLNQGREKNRQKTGPLWRLIHPAND